MRHPYKDLSLQQLRGFCAICRLGSYAGAARQLGLSPSTVWEQMRGLERQFEVPLLETRDGAVQPTPEGRRLLELALPLLAGLESTREVLRQQRGRPPESITIVSGMRMLMEEIGQAIPIFRRRYPDVRLRLLYVEDREIESLVEQGKADLGLILEPGPGRPLRPTVVHEPAYDLDFVLVAPPRHPLLTRRSLRLRDIVRYPLVLGAPGTNSRRRIEEVLYQHGLLGAMRVAVETNSAALTFAYVRAGAGVGITAGNPRGFLCRGLGVRPLGRWFGAARYVFVWTRGAHVPPAQRELAELIRLNAGRPIRPGR
ncbi:MAG TPA: LysR family transcriptional regulator [Gemmataceae bacterium]|nr:LysR family transcriptional regulator [Gemmataceae bacterium]